MTISADADLSNKSEIPAAVTNIVFWGEGATQPKLTIKGMSVPGALTKLEFYNLNITAPNGYIVNQNAVDGSFADIIISSCTLKTLRGVVRYRLAAADKSLHLEIADCIIDDLTGGSHYGVLQTEKVAISSIAVEMTNTTIANTGVKAATIFRTNTKQGNVSLVVKNCTFYNLFSGEALMRDIIGGTNSFTAENILFAGSGSVKIFNKTSDAPGIINGSKIYSSSDLTVANAGEVSTTALSYSSSQLFPNASSSTDVLDLTFGADIPNEVKIIGDPRWNK